MLQKETEATKLVCKPIEKIELIFALERSISEREKGHMLRFLRQKHEIDFRTLSNSDRQLPTNQHSVLYDDLCKYAVIKEIKIKKKGKDIESTCRKLRISDSYKITDRVRRVAGIIPFCFDRDILNYYLKLHKIKQLNSYQQQNLKKILSKPSTIDFVKAINN